MLFIWLWILFLIKFLFFVSTKLKETQADRQVPKENRKKRTQANEDLVKEYVIIYLPVIFECKHLTCLLFFIVRSRFSQPESFNQPILHICFDPNFIDATNGNRTNVHCFIDACNSHHTRGRINRRGELSEAFVINLHQFTDIILCIANPKETITIGSRTRETSIKTHKYRKFHHKRITAGWFTVSFRRQQQPKFNR